MSAVVVEREGQIGLVTLNRPEVMNAMNTEMGAGLRDALQMLARDGDIRCVIVTGAGSRAFCAGADLKERQGLTDEAWQRQHVVFEEASAALRNCPLPVIAAIEGYAMGGGCELALGADILVAAETAAFALPETTRGLIPGIGGTQLAARALGKGWAKYLIFSGRRLSAAEAHRLGMVQVLTPAGGALAAARALAAEIAANAPVAVRQAKQAINRGAELDLESGIAFELEAYYRAVLTEDRKEGIRAFNEKRAPRFEGR